MNQRLKHLRVTHALSQSHIADCLGISQSAYSQIEKGSVSISVEHLKILSKKFNVSLDWLIWGKGPRVSSYQAKELIPLVSIASQGAYAKNTGNDKFTTSLPHCKIPGFTDPRHQVFEVPEEDLAPHLLPVIL
ncbi:MAG: helix-turn-helix transcriptional regulator [Owenweeksia sp.]|nr:helix-turn-helix transcriptional regulator [Owenweeksia sp.]